MAIAIETPPTPRTRRFTVDEVMRMVNVGIIRPDERLELIDGELRIVSPQGFEHADTIEALDNALAAAYGRSFQVQVQLPLERQPDALPEPDLAVRRTGRSRVAMGRHPRCDETLLVVEVAATSAAIDRRKGALYPRQARPSTGSSTSSIAA